MNRALVFVLILLIGCQRKGDSNRGILRATVKDSIGARFGSSQVPEAESTAYDTYTDLLKEGNYSKVTRKNNLSAELFYTVKEGTVEYRHLKIYTGKKVQDLEAVSDWGFLNADEFEIHFEDVNFDGADDITLTKEIGMNWYADRLWINNNGTFISHKEYEKNKKSES